MWGVLCGLVLFHMSLPGVEGHGRLLDPPSRSSLWRFPEFKDKVQPNYDDNQLFCGGFAFQQAQGGKCGLCGDPWPGPRDNEAGGKYATGIISRKYRVGQVIEVHVQLTANHKGWFEFRLCRHDNPLTNITQACLDRHLLALDDSGSTRYTLSGSAGQAVSYSTEDIHLRLRLPAAVSCSACVLQWKYNAGNSWGVDPLTGQGCIGCGPQEQFYGCADVAIGRDDVQVGVIPTHETPDREFPWLGQDSDSEWSYGIAYVFGDTASISGAGGVGRLGARALTAAVLLATLSPRLFGSLT